MKHQLTMKDIRMKKEQRMTKNERGAAKTESEKQKAATEKQKVTVQVGNGKCGSETATKLEGPYGRVYEVCSWYREK